MDARDVRNIEGVAALLAQGKSLEQIAIDTALDLPIQGFQGYFQNH
jgi:hypothetical protein